MLNKLFVFPVLFFTTGCKSSSPRLDGEVYQRAAECLSETDEESVVCFVGLLGEYSQEYIEETVFGRPRNIEEKNIEVCESHGCMTLKAWSYLPRHPEPVVSIILLPGMRSSQVILKQLVGVALESSSSGSPINVYTMDTIGYGDSTGTLPTDMMEGAIKSVEKLMEMYGLVERDTIVAGHSLGGIVAQNFALRHPGMKRVVNIDGGRFEEMVSEADRMVMHAQLDDEKQKALDALARLPSEKVHEAIRFLDNNRMVILKEVRGTTEAWTRWLSNWYISLDWERSLELIEVPMVLIKAVKNESSKIIWLKHLGDTINSGRSADSSFIKVVCVVASQAQIVLLKDSIRIISTELTM